VSGPTTIRGVDGALAFGGEISAEVATRIRLVVFDVDGVLTDAGVYLGRSAAGEEIELKRFDIQDGLGMKFLRWAGLDVALVSGRFSEATSMRARELGIDECHQDSSAQKLPVLEDMLERKSLSWDQVAMLADDLPDVAVLSRVGLPAAVANAQPEVLELAAWRSRAEGGRGAVREFCRSLLLARGEWDRVVSEYVEKRGGLP